MGQMPLPDQAGELAAERPGWLHVQEAGQLAHRKLGVNDSKHRQNPIPPRWTTWLPSHPQRVADDRLGRFAGKDFDAIRELVEPGAEFAQKANDLVVLAEQFPEKGEPVLTGAGHGQRLQTGDLY